MWRTPLSLSVAVFLLLSCTSTVDAQAQSVECSLRQITQGDANTDSTGAYLADEASQVVVSTTTLAEGGTRELFLIDTDDLSSQQITDNSSFDGSATISADGQWVAYVSTSNDTGDNADGNREIMLYSVASEQRFQITDSSTGDNNDPQISRDGSRIVFTSRNDLTGDNPSGNQQAFLYEQETRSLRQLTSGTLFSSGYVSDRTARWLLITSSEDLTGGNPDLNDEVFLIDIESMELVQVTSTVTGFNGGSALSNDGRFVGLFSESEEIVGPEGPKSALAVLDRTTGGIELLTDGFLSSAGLLLSGDGRRALVTNNLAIEFHDLALGQVVELVPANGFIHFGNSISSDGEQMTFYGNSNLTGDNPDFSFEVFLAECTNPAAVFRDGFELGSATAWSQSVP